MIVCSIRAIGWLAPSLATVGLWAVFPARPSASDRLPEDVVLVRDVRYGSAGDGSESLDLLLPAVGASSPLRPILVAVHGGSWSGGSRQEYRAQFAPIARAGVAVAVIDYRLARPGAPSWDGALDDVLAAVDRLIREAPSLGLDPTRVATLGTSSGGMLAALAAQRDPRIRAAVCLASPTSLIDLAASRRQVHEPSRMFLGADPAAAPARASRASPLDQVATGGPAFLLIHGDDDAWVPIEQARKMRERLRDSGVTCQLLELPGVRHGFEPNLGEPAPQDLSPVILDFLKRIWIDGGGEAGGSSPFDARAPARPSP
ncbi:alpha/beta hydrolase [Paludisphaera soli]|uniref:alpha/beta hydrolase n=1 Tax=Paludisphaera soli TaxID=2712865 RepID=UPI0013EB2F8D|nr:alpha/beta hydrolase [Paludisphaera soli]